MILDDNKGILYISEAKKMVKLTELENRTLYFLIKNKDKKVKLSSIMAYVYEIDEDSDYYIGNMSNLIHRLNFKIKPYTKIVAKSKVGYYLKVRPLIDFIFWKQHFFEVHQDEKMLLDLYKKKTREENKLKNLEKTIKTLEKKIS